MGNFSILLVNHDTLHHLAESKDFGKSLSDAITSSRRVNCNTDVRSGERIKVGELIGNYFNGSSPQIVVAEGNTAWLANGYNTPTWSIVTPSFAKRMLFGKPRPKPNTKPKQKKVS